MKYLTLFSTVLLLTTQPVSALTADQLNKQEAFITRTQQLSKLNEEAKRLVEEEKQREEQEKQEAQEQAQKEAEEKAKQEEQKLAEIAISQTTTKFTDSNDQALFNQVTQDLSNPTLNGLKTHVKKMKLFLGAKFGITDFSLYRAGDTDGQGTGHADGLAIDLMVPIGSQLGDDIATYLAQNFHELGISYIIWEQRFYNNLPSIYGPAYTWNLMEDRGSATQNHYDHVHISFNP